jgi:hypothetical protein
LKCFWATESKSAGTGAKTRGKDRGQRQGAKTGGRDQGQNLSVRF